MDFIQFMIEVIGIAPKFFPPPKPPHIDYTELIDKIPHYSDSIVIPTYNSGTPLMPSSSISIIEKPVSISRGTKILTDKVTPLPTGNQRDVATACLSCTRSHLNTVAGLLNESLRFARSDGVQNPEVQFRLNKIEQEMNVMERIDLAPEKILELPQRDQEIINLYLPRIRKLRQNITEINSVDEIAQSAASTSVLTQELRLRQMQHNGDDLNPVHEIVRKVKAGEMSMEQARVQLRALLPPEEEEEEK